MLKMDVLGVRARIPDSEVVVILAESGGARVVPIVIGPREGASIASAQAGLVPPRPQTHDLFMNTLAALGRSLVVVRIVDLIDGTFHAELVLDGEVVVDSRASDAIALAVRAGCDVLCAEHVVEAAGVLIEEDDESERDEEEAVEEFKTFLEGISPEDFRA
ncbi:MAG TPA: bifunctional nuclease family protein [Actinotalea sp.]|nr:bifunctional nuclease family protein [Actinotalea sp.]